MSKPLPTQNTFSGVAPPWSLPNLDANFTNLWGAVNDIGTYSNTLQDTGAVNGLAANPPAGVTFSLAAGVTVAVIAANTTTSSTPTLNVNSTGAKTITDTLNNALSVGAIQSGGRYLFNYDGTNWRCLNAGFVQRAAVKPTVTARNNTNTLTIDPDLQITLAPGIYRFEYCIDFACSVGGATPGAQYQPAFSTNSYNSGVATMLSANSVSNIFGVITAPPAGGPSIALSAFPNINSVMIVGHIQPTASGILSLYWCQASSNPTLTQLLANSHLFVTQLG